MAAALLGHTLAAGPARAGEPSAAAAQWDSGFALRAAAGYRDNVTLAHLDPEASAFLASGFDALVSRLAVDTPRLGFVFSADHVQYLSAPSVEREQSVIAHAEARQFASDRLDLGMEADYVYVNQVVDVSTTETNRNAILAEGHTLGARPGVSLDLTPRLWTTLEVPFARQWYETPLDDYWRYGGRLEFAFECGRNSKLSLSYEPARRLYDHEAELAADGTPQPGTHRRLVIQELALDWTHAWDVAQRWNSNLRFGAEWARDKSSGYFDYDRLGGSARLGHRAARWDFLAEAGAAYYDYPVQTVSATDPRRRERTSVFANVRCGVQVRAWLRIEVEYGYERALSNDPFERYSAQSVQGTFQWEF